MTIAGSELGATGQTQWHNGARIPGPLRFLPGVYLAPNAPSKTNTPIPDNGGGGKGGKN